MYLVKSCKGKDHISSRGTIRLGSLYGYREIEQESIRDKGEGTFNFRIILEGTVEIDVVWFNTIFGRTFHLGSEDQETAEFPGYFHAHVERMTVDSMKDGKAILTNSSARISRSAFNGFVYCMSELSDPDQALGMFADYDAYWSISLSDAHEFAKASVASLSKTIIEQRNIGNHIIPPEIRLEDLSVHVRYEQVKYLEREIHISEASKESLDIFMTAMEDMSFIKPLRFSRENEYRFSYTIHKKNQIIPPTVRNLNIPAENIMHLLKKNHLHSK